MTEKQKDRIRNKIAKLKKALAADKKQWGGQYRDGQGLRYLLPGLFIQLQDYNVGLRYLGWFAKTFPEDSGYPIFLFEWTLILFKKGKIKEAAQKACRTFASNTYLFDKFLDKELLHFEIAAHSNWELESLTDHFPYKKPMMALKILPNGYNPSWLVKSFTNLPMNLWKLKRNSKMSLEACPGQH